MRPHAREDPSIHRLYHPTLRYQGCVGFSACEILRACGGGRRRHRIAKTEQRRQRRKQRRQTSFFPFSLLACSFEIRCLPVLQVASNSEERLLLPEYAIDLSRRSFSGGGFPRVEHRAILSEGGSEIVQAAHAVPHGACAAIRGPRRGRHDPHLVEPDAFQHPHHRGLVRAPTSWSGRRSARGSGRRHRRPAQPRPVDHRLEISVHAGAAAIFSSASSGCRR